MDAYRQIARDFGTAEKDGLELILTQVPYVEIDKEEDPFYTAMATCKDGDEYRVEWPLKDCYRCDSVAFAELQEESDACNWDVYTVTKL